MAGALEHVKNLERLDMRGTVNCVCVVATTAHACIEAVA